MLPYSPPAMDLAGSPEEESADLSAQPISATPPTDTVSSGASDLQASQAIAPPNEAAVSPTDLSDGVDAMEIENVQHDANVPIEPAVKTADAHLGDDVHGVNDDVNDGHNSVDGEEMEDDPLSEVGEGKSEADLNMFDGEESVASEDDGTMSDIEDEGLGDDRKVNVTVPDDKVGEEIVTDEDEDMDGARTATPLLQSAGNVAAGPFKSFTSPAPPASMKPMVSKRSFDDETDEVEVRKKSLFSSSSEVHRGYQSDLMVPTEQYRPLEMITRIEAQQLLKQWAEISKAQANTLALSECARTLVFYCTGVLEQPDTIMHRFIQMKAYGVDATGQWIVSNVDRDTISICVDSAKITAEKLLVLELGYPEVTSLSYSRHVCKALEYAIVSNDSAGRYAGSPSYGFGGEQALPAPNASSAYPTSPFRPPTSTGTSSKAPQMTGQQYKYPDPSASRDVSQLYYAPNTPSGYPSPPMLASSGVSPNYTQPSPNYSFSPTSAPLYSPSRQSQRHSSGGNMSSPSPSCGSDLPSGVGSPSYGNLTTPGQPIYPAATPSAFSNLPPSSYTETPQSTEKYKTQSPTFNPLPQSQTPAPDSAGSKGESTQQSKISAVQQRRSPVIDPSLSDTPGIRNPLLRIQPKRRLSTDETSGGDVAIDEFNNKSSGTVGSGAKAAVTHGKRVNLGQRQPSAKPEHNSSIQLRPTKLNNPLSDWDVSSEEAEALITEWLKASAMFLKELLTGDQKEALSWGAFLTLIWLKDEGVDIRIELDYIYWRITYLKAYSTNGYGQWDPATFTAWFGCELQSTMPALYDNIFELSLYTGHKIPFVKELRDTCKQTLDLVATGSLSSVRIEAEGQARLKYLQEDDGEESEEERRRHYLCAERRTR